MTRAGVIFGCAAVAASALSLGVYAMKYEVERLDLLHTALQRQLAQQEETLAVLEAEWSFLNRPQRLQELATRHLELKPVAVRQIGVIEALPLRAGATLQTSLVQQESRVPPPRLTPALSPAQAAAVGMREGP